MTNWHLPWLSQSPQSRVRAPQKRQSIENNGRENMSEFTPRLFYASSAERRETPEEHHVGDSASEESDVEASQSENIQENTSDIDNSDETDVEERGLLPRQI